MCGVDISMSLPMPDVSMSLPTPLHLQARAACLTPLDSISNAYAISVLEADVLEVQQVDEESAGLHEEGGASGAGTLLAAAHGHGGGGGGGATGEAPEANLRGSNKGTESSGLRGLSTPAGVVDQDQLDRDSIVVYDGGGSLRLVTWKLINHLVEDARKRSTNPAFV